MHHFYKLYLITDNLSKSFQKEKCVNHLRSKNCPTDYKNLSKYVSDEGYNLFYEYVSVKASKQEFISNPATC